MIDIIIPAYNAHKTIDKAVASIATQTLSNLITVTIVNDCSTKDYSSTIKKFKDVLDIRQVTLKRNVGCGKARQTGIESTKNPYIVFMDSDDILFSPLSIAALLRPFEVNPNTRAVYGKILEYSLDTGESQLFPSNTWTWIFGNMYKREFLEQNNVAFLDSSAGEDVGFNRIIKLLCMEEQDTIVFLDEITYLWTDANKENRINTLDFIHHTSKGGYIDNVIYSHKVASKSPKVSQDTLVLDAVVNMVEVYLSYIDLMSYKPDQREWFMEYAKKYYNEVYKNYIPFITQELAMKVYYDNLFRLLYTQGTPPQLNEYTFVEFVQLLAQ